jgi:hypothetical protein
MWAVLPKRDVEGRGLSAAAAFCLGLRPSAAASGVS